MVEWKEPGASDSASCVALGKLLTARSLSFPGCPCAEWRGPGGVGAWPRLGAPPLKVSQPWREDWNPALLTSRPWAVCPLTLKTLGCSASPGHWRHREGPQRGWREPRPLKPKSNLLPHPPWPVPREGAKTHQLRHQLAGGTETDKSTSCPEAPY